MIKNLFELIQSNLDKILLLRSNFELKSDNSFVSKGDIFIQDLVFDYFLNSLPNHFIISEEMNYGNQNWINSNSYIIVDPIDGTENFVSGIKEWGVGVSIYNNGIHNESGIFLPELGEMVLSGDKIQKFNSRIVGLSSSLTNEDLIRLPHGYEYRIIGCSMYNTLQAVKGSFSSFENVNGVNCWDILPGLNLALENGCNVYVDNEIYLGQLLFPTKKYKIKISN